MLDFICPFDSPGFEVSSDACTGLRIMQKTTLVTPGLRFLGTREFLRPITTPPVLKSSKLDPPYKGSRGDFEWYSYAQIYKMTVELALGLQCLGITKGTKIGIISINRVEWVVLDLACIALGAVLVPIYDTQSTEEVILVTNDSQISILFAAPDRLPKWADAAPKCPSVKTVIIFDDRLDDRVLVLDYHSQFSNSVVCPDGKTVALSMPTHTPTAPRRMEEFEEGDRKYGCYNPRRRIPEEQNAAEGTKSRYPRIISTLRDTANDSHGAYFYLPEKKDIPHLAHQLLTMEKGKYGRPEAMQQLMKLVSGTYHQIAALGRDTTVYKEMFSKYAHASNSGIAGYSYLYSDDFPITSFPPLDLEVSQRDDLMTLIYTSGTTGNPKGVKLSHGNVMHTAISMQCSRLLPLQSQQHYTLSFLPNAHIFMRVINFVSIHSGACMGFWQGDIKLLVEDVQMLCPTFFVAVPRVLNKLFDGIMAKVSAISSFKRFVFFAAYGSRRKALLAKKPWPGLTNKIFSSTKALLGGRCSLCVTGSAPLSQKVGEFLRITCDMELFEGWGMSETAAHGVVQPTSTMHWGTVGVTLDSSTKIRLNSVPDMDYLVTDKPNPRGEVWIKGPSVFSGYYNDDGKTKETLTEDGWFMTGDIGEYDRSLGELRLIDRKRGIFKLAQGEYISATTIENAIGRCKYIEQCIMHGSRFESYVLCVVVLNIEVCQKELSHAIPKDLEGKLATALQDLGEYPRLKDLFVEVLQAVQKTCKENGLRSFEIPKALAVEGDPWTPENGCLTPAMKVKKNNVLRRHETTLTDVYRRINHAGLQNVTPQGAVELYLDSLISGPMSDTASSGFSGFSGFSRPSSK